MEDKIVDCKDANINFNNTVMILILTIPALFGMVYTLAVFKEIEIIAMNICLIIIDCIVMYNYGIKRMIRYIIVRRKGKEVTATVKGYCDDDYIIDEEPAQKVILSVKTDTGEKEFYYKLSSTIKKYEINSEIELYAYNDIYLIKDKKKNKRQARIIGITFTILIIMALFFATNVYISFILKKTPDQIKMEIIEKNNKDLKVRFNDLKYKIPEDYHLYIYQEDWQYEFETKNNDHHCSISILSMESKRSNTPVGECEYYDLNHHYEKYSEVQLNGLTWCYDTKNREETIVEKYMINDGKNYYSITLENHKDNDEKCTTSFNEFKKTIKLNE